MKITLTDSAIKKLHEQIGNQEGYLKIQYVTEGLSCNAGVPTLCFVPTVDSAEDILFETNDRPVLLEKVHMINFDDELKIDYSESAHSFQLKSPQQIFNGRMSFHSRIHS